MIKREKIELHEEKNLLLGCVVSTEFLQNMRGALNDLSLLQEKHNRIIVKWCTEHYDRYNEAPKDKITDLFLSNKKQIRNEETADAIEDILGHISDKYSDEGHKFDHHFYTAKSRDYLEERKLLDMSKQVSGLVSLGKIDDARALVTGYSSGTVAISKGYNPMDLDFVKQTFSAMKESALEFPLPVLNELFKEIYYGDVIGFAGTAKKGKSFFLNQLGYYAAQEKMNVAIFSFEMDAELVNSRFLQWLLGESRVPMKEKTRIPHFDKSNNIYYTDIKKDGLNEDKALDYITRMKKYGQPLDNIRIFDSKTCGRKISNIKNALQRLEKEDDFKVDFVVIDYDSLIEMESGFVGNEYAMQTEVWRRMKLDIAQDMGCIVASASQLTRSAINNDAGIEDTAGSIRKFDFVSLWCNLNQSPQEKQAKLMRLSVQGRNGEFDQLNHVVVTQSLALGRPILDARWVRDVPNYNEIVGGSPEPEEDEDTSENKVKNSWSKK